MCYKFSLIVSFVFILCFSCIENKKTTQSEITRKTIKPHLELIWETDSLLTTCESVLYDETSKKIYVANINNGPWDFDNNGFISIIDVKGQITELKWMEGLSAPKGMGMHNGKLYVNDIYTMLEIDIKNRNISNKYTVEGNPQLNDITISPEGVVYSSGSNSNAIYKLLDSKLSLVAKDSLGRLNGLLWQKEALYYLNFSTKNFGALNLETKAFKVLTKEIGDGDGLVRLENGDFITSGWKGEVFYINAENWTKTKLLDTQKQSIFAADIDYIPETQTLLIPTFFHNRVMAYKLSFSDAN